MLWHAGASQWGPTATCAAQAALFSDAAGAPVDGTYARTQRKPDAKSAATPCWRMPRHTDTTDAPKCTVRRGQAATAAGSTCGEARAELATVHCVTCVPLLRMRNCTTERQTTSEAESPRWSWFVLDMHGGWVCCRGLNDLAAQHVHGVQGRHAADNHALVIIFGSVPHACAPGPRALQAHGGRRACSGAASDVWSRKTSFTCALVQGRPSAGHTAGQHAAQAQLVRSTSVPPFHCGCTPRN